MQETIQYILDYPNVLLSRDSVIDIFTDAEIVSYDDIMKLKLVRLGKMYMIDDIIHIVSKIDGDTISESIPTTIKKKGKLLSFQDTFTLTKGAILNYNGKPMETTIGKFLLNYVLLVDPFGDVVQYNNTSPWPTTHVENNEISVAAMDDKITTDQILTYVNNVYFLASYADFCSVAFTEKSIMVDKDVVKHRDMLLDKHKDELHDPNTMMLVEDELIALDKKSLEGDPSSNFLIKKKAYNVQRKREFLALGMVEAFGDTDKSYEFIPTNLNDGWKVEDFDTISNDIRRGSYHRAKSTAKGGATSKFLGRSFQESSIVSKDCKTTRTLSVNLTKANHKYFMYMNIVVGSKLVALTKDTISKYIGTTVNLRSPMYCSAKGGHCYKCMDSRFEKLDIVLLNTAPINIGSTILSLSMAAMHGTKLETFTIDNIDTFTV
jgi:hypothetical protein